MDGDPRPGGPIEDRAGDLPVPRLAVEAALADHDRLGAGQAAVEVEGSAGRTRSPPAAAPRRGPRGLRRGRRRRPTSPCPGGRGGVPRRSRSSRSVRRLTCSGEAPFCGPNTIAAASNGIRTSQASSRSISPIPPPCSIAATAPSPPSLVAVPPIARIARTCARLPGGKDQLPGAGARGALGVALVIG